jgi:cell fate (sporulation/competence/biofilm development) regulator YlbF (YheA/YmcA/DUF963 family)
MKTFKGGGYDRLYGTAVEEAKEAIRLTESGKPTSMILSKILRDNDELAFGTFAKYVAIPVPILTDMGVEMPTPVYKAGGVMNNLASFENRLRRARMIVTKTEAQVLMERGRTIKDFIFTSSDIGRCKDEQKLQKARARARVVDALHGHSAFMRLVQRTGNMNDITKLIREEWAICVTGQPEFKLEHARWLDQGSKGKTLSILDIPQDEDMYFRSDVSEDETMMISGIPLHVLGKEKYLTQVTKSQIGLYQINSEMLQWAENLSDKLKMQPERPIGRSRLITLLSEDREWVNDDSSLIGMAIEDFKFFGKNEEAALITRDKRLANQMSISANIRVVMIDPLSLVHVYPDKVWCSTTTLSPREIFDSYGPSAKMKNGLKVPHRVYIDTGSLLSILSSLEEEGEGASRKIFRRTPVESGIRSGTRFEIFDRVRLPNQRHLSVRLYDPTFGIEGGRKKSSTYSDSRPSSRFRWTSDGPSFDEYIVRRKALQF